MIQFQMVPISSKSLQDPRMEIEILSEEKLSFVSLDDDVTINRRTALPMHYLQEEMMTTVQHTLLTTEWRCMDVMSKFSFTAHNPLSVTTCANWTATLSSDVSQQIPVHICIIPVFSVAYTVLVSLFSLMWEWEVQGFIQKIFRGGGNSGVLRNLGGVMG